MIFAQLRDYYGAKRVKQARLSCDNKRVPGCIHFGANKPRLLIDLDSGMMDSLLRRGLHYYGRNYYHLVRTT